LFNNNLGMKQKKISSIFSAVLMVALLGSSCSKIDPDAPEACFTPPEAIVAGVPAIFTTFCSENAGSYSWDFGDGGTSQEENPQHTYQAAGTYTVTLTVTTMEGDTDQASVSVTVTAPEVYEHSGNITEDETWPEGTHLITSDVSVSGAILTIEPGAVIRFAAGRGLYIGNSSNSAGAVLIADGTAEKPITFTSAATNKSPGDWDFIGFYAGASATSSMQYCIVEYGGGYNQKYGEIYIDGTSVSIDNCTVRHSSTVGIGLTSDGWFRSFTGNTLSDIATHPVNMYGNYVHTIGEGNQINTDRGVFVEGDDVEMEDATWQKLNVPYVVGGDLYVGSATGTTLTLMPGTELRMGSGTGLHVGYGSSEFGRLVAEGTESEHIVFTSSAPEAARSPGDWDYLAFYEGAGNNSSLSYCDFSYGGGYSGNYGMIHVDGSRISMTHCSVTLSESQGVSLRNDASFTGFSDNSFGNNATVPVEIYGNFVHTIGPGNSFETGTSILVKGDNLEQSDVTWSRQNIPYLIDGTLYVGSATGSRLTVEPGTTVKFSEGSDLYVGYRSGTFGVLVADGEPGNQITFTSGALAGFEAPGDWDGIWFDSGTGNGSVLDHCVISYAGGYSSNSGNVIVRNSTANVPLISNCEISHSGAYGIYLANNANPELTGITYQNNVLGDTNK